MRLALARWVLWRIRWLSLTLRLVYMVCKDCVLLMLVLSLSFLLVILSRQFVSFLVMSLFGQWLTAGIDMLAEKIAAAIIQNS
jgi:hypothetical protein